MKEKTGSVKRAFEFTREANGRLERLVAISGESSVAEFLRRAIRTMDFLLTECDMTAGVTVKKKTGETVALMLKDI